MQILLANFSGFISGNLYAQRGRYIINQRHIEFTPHVCCMGCDVSQIQILPAKLTYIVFIPSTDDAYRLKVNLIAENIIET